MKSYSLIIIGIFGILLAIVILPLIKIFSFKNSSMLEGKSKAEVIRVFNRILFDFNYEQFHEQKYINIYEKIEELMKKLHDKADDDFKTEIEEAKKILVTGLE